MYITNEYTIMTKTDSEGKEIKVEIRPNKPFSQIPEGFKVWSDVHILIAETGETAEYLRAGQITGSSPVLVDKKPQRPEEPEDELMNLTLEKLRVIAMEKGVQFNTKTTKPQIVEAINNA